MANPIEITFPQAQLYPGSATKAQIVIDVTKPTKVRNITARIDGFETAEAEYTSTNADGESESQTARETVDVLKEEFLLFGNERKGFFDD